MEEARKVEEAFCKVVEEVQQYRAQLADWEKELDDGLDPQADETMEVYCKRVRPLFHQNW